LLLLGIIGIFTIAYFIFPHETHRLNRYCDLRQTWLPDYEIMIFDPVLTNRPPGFYWNHGQSHGVAISTARNEIVYWAEAW
jgi:hypothetical protein